MPYMSVTSTLAHVTKREGIGKFYSIDEVAELLGVSPRTVRAARLSAASMRSIGSYDDFDSTLLPRLIIGRL
jgi:hypothetical protein